MSASAQAFNSPDCQQREHNMSALSGVQWRNKCLDGEVGLIPDVISYWDTPSKVILCISMAIFIALTITGNILVLTVIIKNKHMQTKTNAFIANLAVADLLVAIVDMPMALITVIEGDWVFGDTLCVLNGFTVVFFLTVSVHTLMYIAVFKYITITHPMSKVLTKTRVGYMIAAPWIWGLIASSMGAFWLSDFTFKPGATQCGPNYPTEAPEHAYAFIIIFSCYFVPIIVMVGSYISIFIQIRAHLSRMKANTTQDHDVIVSQEKQMTVTLLIMIIVFFVCWTPFMVYCIFASAVEDKTTIPHELHALGYWLGYMNSVCNPIIYALRVPKFQDGYQKLFYICKVQKNLPINNEKSRSHSGSEIHMLQAISTTELNLKKSKSVFV
ncbi:octopamine receptor 1-like [Lingula anatina]|uniref:Octopamine receptor 1-like n=1 Tax=Lingula anatina TaxID=7574 RepID=A0A1S3JGU0_LINAN|nr:octopamine receptor 1-like [Lingula anatina]XP_013409106.1 octopamine receptor 1-like [Lingula anatina]XP_013409114.1 octopamine receptor 1-like [Lingula anatina]|eukprot:XP_013409099.1 octopamine receptor 1-like [Lingula anatina]